MIPNFSEQMLRDSKLLDEMASRYTNPNPELPSKLITESKAIAYLIKELADYVRTIRIHHT